jgi:pimeloyl-ACP methyl ester carboxylesterase
MTAAQARAEGARDWTRRIHALQQLPAQPRKVTGAHNWLNGARLFVDYLATVPPKMQRLTAGLRGYPDDFEKVRFTARDGVELVGWLGRCDPALGPRDAVILIPGLYTSKDNHRIRARAMKLRREWGLNVLTLDLRGVGESQRVFTTPAYKEAQDLIDAIAFVRKAVDVRRVHVYAESLAASAAVLAAGLEGHEGRRLVDGTVLAMSPYADARAIVELYAGGHGHAHELGPDFAAVRRFFNGLLRLQGYKGGRFDAYVQDAARYYGMTTGDLLDRSSPVRYAAEINVPVLVVHSRDDGLVPVSQAEALATAARANPWLQVWILEWGYHALYEMAEPEWYWSVLARLWDVKTERRAAPDVFN